MKLIFAGTPHFAALLLDKLILAGYDMPLVLTQPDRPSGRGMKLMPSPVKALACDHHIPVFQALSLKEAAAQKQIRAVGADLMIVAAYGLILPQAVLDMPPLGCLNVHASLLPRWRGAAPIQRAILAGDTKTGVCLMQMAAGLDTGPVLASEAIPITQTETTQSLHDKLASLGGELLLNTLPRLPLAAAPQAEDGVTYADKIKKEEARLDWQESAEILDRKIRAFSPAPGAFAALDDAPIKIWKATLVKANGAPAQILKADAKGILVACGKEALLIEEMQKAGGKRLSASDFLKGHAVTVGGFFR